MPAQQTLLRQAPSKEAQTLLDRLAEDDTLRRRLESRPLEVLAEHGLEVAPEAVPAVIELPSKTQLREVVAEGLRVGTTEEPPSPKPPKPPKPTPPPHSFHFIGISSVGE
jgi:putative modified peptide